MCTAAMVFALDKYIPNLPGKEYAYNSICEPEHVYTDEIFLKSEQSASQNPTPPVTVPLCVLGDVQLRFLCPDDLEEVRTLCREWFPIGKLFVCQKWVITFRFIFSVIYDN